MIKENTTTSESNSLDSPDRIDVVAIMHEVRRRVTQKQMEGIYPTEDKVSLSPAKEAENEEVQWRLATLQGMARLNLDGDSIHSHRPVIGFFIIKWKKFLRFWIRRYTDTLFLQQSRFNTDSSSLIASLQNEIEQLRHELNLLKEKK